MGEHKVSGFMVKIMKEIADRCRCGPGRMMGNVVKEVVTVT